VDTWWTVTSQWTKQFLWKIMTGDETECFLSSRRRKQESSMWKLFLMAIWEAVHLECPKLSVAKGCENVFILWSLLVQQELTKLDTVSFLIHYFLISHSVLLQLSTYEDPADRLPLEWCDGGLKDFRDWIAGGWGWNISKCCMNKHW
jgi:hypothetical protein